MTYNEHGVTATIERLLEDHGLTGALAPEQLNLLDQFHAGGYAALDRTIEPVSLGPGDRVLDIGSGLGGPARRIAQRTGATVRGVDITEEYTATATYLTERCGLDALVSFEHTDIADHHPNLPYTAAVTMHVTMNIADKPAWYRAIADRLVDGGHLVVWDICSTGQAELPLPLPWSIDGSDNFIVGVDELRGAITSAGFDTIEWVDESAWVREWFETTFKDGLPPGPGIAMWLEDGFTRTINIGVAQAAGDITIVRGHFTKSTAT
jgi:SAM-dependent methyltransferase